MNKDFYRTNNSVWPHTSVPWQQSIIADFIKRVPIAKNWEIVDIGSGVGNNLKSLVAVTNKITVLDISDFALSKLEETYAENFWEVNIIHGDITAEGVFADKKFDLVLMTEVIEHIDQINKVFSHIRKILKPNGYLIISTPNYLNAAGIWKLISERIIGNTWDAWGTHRGGIENFTTSYWLLRQLKKMSFNIIETRGGDPIRSWFPFLRKYYNLIDKHPALVVGKMWPLKYILMNFYVVCQKAN